MSIAITVQVIDGAAGPINGLADDPEITIIRGDTGAVVQAAIAMTDLVVGGFYRFVYTPTVAGLDYAAEIDADPGATGQVPAGNRYYAVAFDDELDEVYRDRGLDPSFPKTATENTPKLDYTERVPLGGAPITKQSVKVGTVTTQTRT